MQTLYDQCLQKVMGKEYERFKIASVSSELSNKTVLTS
jgi:hypothetical protein